MCIKKGCNLIKPRYNKFVIICLYLLNKKYHFPYQVLGNFKKRRLYDKGILTSDSSGPAPREEVDPQTRFYRSRGSTPTGKTPIYDFDEWSREHYGTAFKRREAAKEKFERKVKLFILIYLVFK